MSRHDGSSTSERSGTTADIVQSRLPAEPGIRGGRPLGRRFGRVIWREAIWLAGIVCAQRADCRRLWGGRRWNAVPTRWTCECGGSRRVVEAPPGRRLSMREGRNYCGRRREWCRWGMAVATERDPPARCPFSGNAVSHTGGIYGRITPQRKRHDYQRTQETDRQRRG